MKTSLENKPHHIQTSLGPNEKSPNMGEGDGAEASAPRLHTAGAIRTAGSLWIILTEFFLKEQKSSNAKMTITPFWRYPSHCTEAPTCHGAEGGGRLPVRAPDVPHPVMTSVRAGEGGSPYPPPQPLSTHSSDSFFGHLGFREFFASVCPILNPLIPPVSSLNLSFHVSPRLCFCPSPLLPSLQRNRESPLFS